MQKTNNELAQSIVLLAESISKLANVIKKEPAHGEDKRELPVWLEDYRISKHERVLACDLCDNVKGLREEYELPTWSSHKIYKTLKELGYDTMKVGGVRYVTGLYYYDDSSDCNL